MFTVQEFESFNGRRKSNPWIAKVDKLGKIDFSEKVGGYTGAYGKGEAGILYITNPIEGQVYVWGQKDYYKSSCSFKKYVLFENGQLKDVAGQAFLDALENMKK